MNQTQRAAALLALGALVLRKHGVQLQLADVYEQDALRLLPTDATIRPKPRVAEEPDVLASLDLPEFDRQSPE